MLFCWKIKLFLLLLQANVAFVRSFLTQYGGRSGLFSLRSHQKDVPKATVDSLSMDTLSSAPSLVRPPEHLEALEVGEIWYPIPSAPLSITRVAVQPDIFVLRNFLPFAEDRCSIMDLADKAGMQYAATKSGQVLHRDNSYLAWIPTKEDARDAIGVSVAQHMTSLASHLFLQEDDYTAEDLQVVRYTKNGKFDLHHDGFGRTVTVLTYLNGVAGTWFPYARVAKEETDDSPPPQMSLEAKGMTQDKIPGRNGLWVVSKEDDLTGSKPDNVVCVNPGDAVVFYNYNWLEDAVITDVATGGQQESQTGAIMDWRAVHAGMPTDREKWIATNWYRSEIVTDSLLR